MKDLSTKPKIIILIGQTASGKTQTAIKLAKAIDGEVISADSRQVYKGLNIGSDKITQKGMQGIPHHLIDIADPRTDTYTVSNFIHDATNAIKDITHRGKVPIIAGGTMLYIDALMGNVTVPEVPPNHALRKKLGKKPTEELFATLQAKDPRRAEQMIQEGQNKNPRRLIRALEIIATLGHVPEHNQKCSRGPLEHFDAMWIGLQNDPVVQKQKINKRNAEMLEKGLLEEVRALKEMGITQKQFNTFGFEYKYTAMYLSGTPIIEYNTPTLDDVLMKMNSGTWRYAKKQRAWWRDRSNIHWFNAGKEYQKILSLIISFLETTKPKDK